MQAFFWPRFHAAFYNLLKINAPKKRSVAASRRRIPMSLKARLPDLGQPQKTLTSRA